MLNAVGQRIVDLACKNGVSNQALCRILNAGRNHIQAWKEETSKPTAEEVSIVAKHFNVSTDYILGRTDTPTMNSRDSTQAHPNEDSFLLALKDFLSSANADTLESKGLSNEEFKPYLEGSKPLYLEDACEISQRIGKPLNEMLSGVRLSDDIEKMLAAMSGDERESFFTENMASLSTEHQRMVSLFAQFLASSKQDATP